MEPDRFDATARAVFAAQSRRRLVARVAAGLLAAVGLALADDETQARKRRKRCRGCAACKACVRGRCRPLPDFSPCGGVCQDCQGGKCVNKPDDTVCNTSGRCLTGVCNSQPNCISFNVGGCATLGDAACCSGECDEEVPSGVCTKGVAGRPCKVTADCISGSCIGYVCA